MAIKEQIIRDIREMQNPQALHQLFDYVQNIKKESPNITNLEAVLKFAGIMEDQEAESLHRIITSEFDKIEGEW
ncbi:MAG: hypothetical protein SH848_17135 [Saprospiraceae bacterium]|nr:hypothetical protein [Saprospiraceae bacterium]MDZ4705654.1 hypothetical protein [Saprospiraceae bacterium]